MKKIYLGINKGETLFGKVLKDGGSALIKSDGLYLRAYAEERIRQIKAYGGFEKSLEALLTAENVIVNQIKKISITSCCDLLNISENIEFKYKNKTFQAHPLSHHYSHALTAYAFSKFKKAIVVVWDCGGNYLEYEPKYRWWNATREQHSYYIAEGKSITKIETDFEEPGSMGFGEVYRSLTHLLGFNSYIHSSKAMALTSFGSKTRWGHIKVFEFNNGKISSPFVYKPGDNFDYLVKWAKSVLKINLKKVERDEDLKNQDLLDFAALIQNSMEEVAIKKINYLIDKYAVRDVCLSGGVALNCLLNSKIRRYCELEHFFVPPASGDIGQSIGNAIFSYLIDKGKLPTIRQFTYIGSDCKLSKGDQNETKSFNTFKLRQNEKIRLAAYLLKEGFIIGWVQGKSESGPRALGNRSILCRTDLPNLENKLRNEIKHRKWYEPFAASVLREDVNNYFDINDDVPFMLEVANIKSDCNQLLNNCRHLKDNTCRIQTVSKTQNKTFYKLLSEYKFFSGSSVLLNTSLNHRGFPIAETASDAIDFFKTSKLEVLFVDNVLFLKASLRVSIESILNNLKSDNLVSSVARI